MSWLGDLFGASDTKTTTSVKFPDWVNKASQANYGLATQIASRPYTAYPFQRIAGFSGDQKDAMGMLRDLAPDFAKGAGKFEVPRMIDDIGKGGSVDAYMNPFVDNVLDRTSARIREATDMARQFSSNNTAHAAGAFGDARHGIADALIEEKGIQQMGDAAAEGYAAAYGDAQNMRSADIDRMYRTEGVQQQQMDELMQYIDSLYRSGSNQQNMDQSNMDLGYADFLRQLNHPIDQYNLLTAALTQSPYGSSTTNTQPGPSTAGKIAGGLGSILSLFM